jgi:hypothetical protein
VTTYAIRKWKWTHTIRDDGDETYEPDCAHGNFYVRKIDGCWHWSYCFDEYYNEGQHEVSSATEGKEAAWKHWLEYLYPALTPATNEREE